MVGALCPPHGQGGSCLLPKCGSSTHRGCVTLGELLNEGEKTPVFSA